MLTRAMMWLCSIVATLALSGCTPPNMQTVHHDGVRAYPDSNEVPIASNFPTSLQRKLQAAEHWKRVANFSAAELSASLQRAATCTAGIECRTLVIKRSCETTGCTPVSCETTFGKVFHEELVTAMVNLGYKGRSAQQDFHAPAPLNVKVDVEPLSYPRRLTAFSWR